MSKQAKQGTRANTSKQEIMESLRRASALLESTYRPMYALSEQAALATVLEIADELVVKAMDALL